MLPIGRGNIIYVNDGGSSGSTYAYREKQRKKATVALQRQTQSHIEALSVFSNQSVATSASESFIIAPRVVATWSPAEQFACSNEIADNTNSRKKIEKQDVDFITTISSASVEVIDKSIDILVEDAKNTPKPHNVGSGVHAKQVANTIDEFQNLKNGVNKFGKVFDLLTVGAYVCEFSEYTESHSVGDSFMATSTSLAVDSLIGATASAMSAAIIAAIGFTTAGVGLLVVVIGIILELVVEAFMEKYSVDGMMIWQQIKGGFSKG